MKKKSPTSKRKLSPALFSSQRGDWETPDWLFERCRSTLILRQGVRDFDVDLCASESNSRCRLFYSADTPFTRDEDDYVDGLHAFMNPPYGRDIGKFIYASVGSTLASVTMILPARTDTKWFQWLLELQTKEDVRFDFLPGRVKFCLNGVPQGPAPFPTVIVHV